jgi:UDP-N-acetylglucosamine 4,6-dehydratase/5-epimerase
MSANFKSSTITITGGTGSFGSTMARKLLNEDVSEIRIFSRDENKQDEMRRNFKDDRLRFFLGDVRDQMSLQSVMKNTDFVFHAAALKQVPSCEFFPQQAMYTNVNGSANVIESAIKNEVRSIVCLSTDKAVYPINAMGISKALMEKVAQSYSRNDLNGSTTISITRYGNVMMSRGSVIPLFIKQILENKPITITNPSMTRFMMSLNDSVELVKFAFTNAKPGDLFVKKAPACTVETLVSALTKILDKESKTSVNIIGTRHGEKQAESLLSIEESSFSEDLGDYFRVGLDTRSLNYRSYFEEGRSLNKDPQAFTSDNTNQLDTSDVVELLKSNTEFQELVHNL